MRARTRLRGRVGVRGFLRPRFRLRLPFPFRVLRRRRVDFILVLVLVLILVVATLAVVPVRDGDNIARGMVLGGEL